MIPLHIPKPFRSVIHSGAQAAMASINQASLVKLISNIFQYLGHDEFTVECYALGYCIHLRGEQQAASAPVDSANPTELAPQLIHVRVSDRGQHYEISLSQFEKEISL